MKTMGHPESILGVKTWQGILNVAGVGLEGWGLEAAYMFNREVVGVAGFEIFVEDCKQLVVEDLEFADPVHHALQWLQRHKTYFHTSTDTFEMFT